MIRFCIADSNPPRFKRRIIKKWITDCVIHENFYVGNINFIFCSDEYLLQINQKWLHHDYYTDVVTFDYTTDKIISSDIYISLDRIDDNSIKYNVSYHEELFRVLIHGILHLTGFNDSNKSELAIMRRKENDCLKLLAGESGL